MRTATNVFLPIPAPLREITDSVEARGLPVDVDELGRAAHSLEARSGSTRDNASIAYARKLTEDLTGRVRLRTTHKLTTTTHTVVETPKLSRLAEAFPTAVVADPGSVLVEIDASTSPWQPLAKLSGDEALAQALTEGLYAYAAQELNTRGNSDICPPLSPRTEAKLALFHAFFSPRATPDVRAARDLFPLADKYRSDCVSLGGNLTHVHQLQHDAEADVLVSIWAQLKGLLRPRAVMLAGSAVLYLEAAPDEVPVIVDAVGDATHTGRYGISTDVIVRSGDTLADLKQHQT